MLTRFFSFFLIATALTKGFCADEYSVRCDAYWTSTHFDIKSNGKIESTVEKSSLGVRSTYQISNDWGVYGTAICRLVSWGSLKTVWKVIDVYDNGKHGYLSTIRGTTPGENAGRFEFYDSNGTFFGIAMINLEKGVVDVINPINPGETLVRFEASADENGDLYWSYKRINRWFNIQTMHAFASFLADQFQPTVAFEKPPASIPIPLPGGARRHR